METFGNKIQQNSATRFYCKSCDVKCSTKYNYETHKLSRRHHMETQMETFGNKIQQNSANSANSANSINSTFYDCDRCEKKYKTRGGLWKHKKNCLSVTTSIQSNTILDNFPPHEPNNIILKLLEQNASLQNQIIELSKEKNNVVNHFNNTNVNNRFNIEIFLNEKCKDAVNMMDFINSLQIETIDLENTGKLGYVEGISNIFVKALKKLDIYKRPVHCSDLKREILYVKDFNKWEKEVKENTKIKEVIAKITHKNIKQIPKWVEQNPNYKDINSIENDTYLKLINNSMVGIDYDETENNLNKIISNVAKEVLLCK